MKDGKDMEMTQTRMTGGCEGMYGRPIVCLRCGRPSREGIVCICGFEWVFAEIKPGCFFFFFHTTSIHSIHGNDDYLQLFWK